MDTEIVIIITIIIRITAHICTIIMGLEDTHPLLYQVIMADDIKI